MSNLNFNFNNPNNFNINNNNNNTNLASGNSNSNLNLNTHQQTTNTSSNYVLQTLKRRANKVVVPLDERVTLEKAFGFTVSSNTRLTQNSDGTIAYLAGCVIVLYDTIKQTQEFIISQARKTLTTLAFSADGKLIATGESGHEPKVRVWDVKDKIQICEFGGHKFGIECVCFSPSLTSNIIVSIGSQHDTDINVWNIRKRFKVASGKITCKVNGVSFSRDGAYFVTVGNRHIKFWYLTVSSLMETVPLKNRAAILGEMKNNCFCDVACGSEENSSTTYALTTNGLLCEFNEQRNLSNVIELKTERAYCIYADNYNLYIGCSQGTILVFTQANLYFVASLPRPHNLGVDVARGTDTRHLLENLKNRDAKYPDCVALCYDKYEAILSAIYNDHSFYVWDIKDFEKVKKLDSHLFHSSKCWSLDVYSSTNPTSNLPLDSFITCSEDNTLRVWSTLSASISSSQPNQSKLQRNIYSKDLLKIIYIDNDLSNLCEQDESPENADSITNNSSTLKQVDSTSTSSNANGT